MFFLVSFLLREVDACYRLWCCPSCRDDISYSVEFLSGLVCELFYILEILKIFWPGVPMRGCYGFFFGHFPRNNVELRMSLHKRKIWDLGLLVESDFHGWKKTSMAELGEVPCNAKRAWIW